MGLQLPDYVQQGLGWMPDQIPPDGGSAALPAPDPSPTLSDFGGLHPEVARQLGLIPQPPETPAGLTQSPRPTPTQLPSMAGQASSQPTRPSTDYQIPPSAFGGRSTAAQPSQATKPLQPQPRGFDAQMADLQQREQTNQDQQIAAINQGTEAQHGLHADQLAAVQQNQATLAANDAERQRLQDERDKVYATNTAQVDADRKSIENYKTNPNKFMDEMDLGDHLRWGIAQIMAGYGQALMRNNGPNPVTQMLQDRIHEANVAQRDERDRLVQKLGLDKEARTDASTFSTNRLADIDHKDGLANLSLAKSLELAATKAADPMSAANAMSAAAKVREDGNVLLAKAIETKSQHDLQQQQVGIAGGHLALAKQQFNAEYGPQGFKQQELDLKAADEMRRVQADQAKEAARKAGKLDENTRKLAIAAPVDGSGGDSTVLLDKDGAAHLSRDPETARKNSELIAAVATYNQVAGEMIQDIKSHGGESDYLKSDVWKRQRSRLAQLQAELHDTYGIKRFSEGTQQFFDQMATGGVNPTSFVYDATNALKTSSKDLEAKVNQTLKADLYTGKPVRFPDLSNVQAAKPTPEQERQTLLKSQPNVSYNTALNQATGYALKQTPNDPVTALRAARAEADQYKDISPAQRRALDGLVAQGDDAALAELAQYVRDPREGGAHSAAIREAAERAISEIQFKRTDPASQIPPAPQFQTNYDPHGYNPTELVRRFNQPAKPTLP